MITGNIFSNNVIKGTGDGGAISDAFDVTLTVSNNIFTGNVSGGGGAIEALLVGTGTGTPLTISNNIFTDNSSTQNGGAIELDQFGYPGQINITQNIFTSNSATGDGGAIDNNGATNLLINSNIFTHNSAANGGALYDGTTGNTVTITNNIFTADSASQQGDELWLSGGELSVNGISPTDSSQLIANLVKSNIGLFGDDIYIA